MAEDRDRAYILDEIQATREAAVADYVKANSNPTSLPATPRRSGRDR